METINFFQNIKIVVTVVHVLAIAFGMGAALASDVLFSFFSEDKKLNNTEIVVLSILAKIVLYGLLIIIISGIALFLSDIEGYLYSAKFLAKMSILFVLLINGYFLNKYIWPHILNRNFFTLKKERNIRRLAFVCGAISIISWISVCTLGVLDILKISYAAIMSLYLVITLFGVFVSLVVEKRKLN